MGRDANPIFSAETMALPCWPLWPKLRERSTEGALSSTGSAWVCYIGYTNNVPFQARHAKKHMKITQRCDESSCQILNMAFDRMDIDIDSDTPDRRKKNATPRAVRRYVTMTFAHPCDKSFLRNRRSNFESRDYNYFWRDRSATYVLRAGSWASTFKLIEL